MHRTSTLPLSALIPMLGAHGRACVQKARPASELIGAGVSNGKPQTWPERRNEARIRFIRLEHSGIGGNDAWISQDYTDVTPGMRENSMKLGFNLVFYACSHRNQALDRN